MNQTAIAATAPNKITQRHPAIPKIVSGPSFQAANATIGTARNWIDWLKAKARPRTDLGTSSAM